MPKVPDAYYQFVMDYAPYVYVVPSSGPDVEWGRAAFAAAFAIDFLFEAYFDPQFDDRSAEIEAKIVELADWILTQQCTDSQKQAYGGFKSTENSNMFYSVDACRTVPALLKAYELTTNAAYLSAAKLAAATFLYNMQHKPSQISLHDRYYGGFAKAVTLADAWLPQMDVECLYGLAALKMLCESDPANRDTYESMMLDAAAFYRPGLEGLYLYYDPPPAGDGRWHRTSLDDSLITDDSLAYALLGLYAIESWSDTVRNAYAFVNAISASPLYAAYNPAICWAGYIDVVGRAPACDYYDNVTAGILAQIRRDHDKSAYEFSVKIIAKQAEKFMFWGCKHADYSFVENKQAMVTVCWLAQLLLGYEPPTTRFTQILRSKGESITLYPLKSAGERPAYGAGTDVKAIILPTKAEALLLEPGYVADDYLLLHVFAPVRRRDKIRRNGEDYEILSVQDFTFKGEVALRKVLCRRIIGQ